MEETATNEAGSATQYTTITSTPVSEVTSDSGGSYSGIPVSGQTITAESTVSDNAGLTIATNYKFLRVNTGEANTELQDGSSPSYTLTGTDVGHAIKIEMLASVRRADNAEAVDTKSVNLLTPTVTEGLSNTALPSVGGDATVGATLTATRGSWSGGGEAVTYSYQWRRCNTSGSECADITGATQPTYALVATDAAHTLRMQITATNGEVTDTVSSTATETIAAASALLNTSAPTITGTPTDRQTLTGTPGTWSGEEPITYRYQWESCQPDGERCENIEDATQPTYLLTSADVGTSIRLRITATNGAGSATAATTATDTITAAPAPVNETLPNIALLGPADVGATITTEGGTWTNVDQNTLEYQWQRCNASGESCEDITGALDQSYELTSGDAGSRIRVVVTAANETAQVAAISALSPMIESAQPAPGPERPPTAWCTSPTKRSTRPTSTAATPTRSPTAPRPTPQPAPRAASSSTHESPPMDK